MNALLFDHRLSLATDYPRPTARAGESLIRILQSGICNTDLELMRGYMAFSGVLGHEFVGIVEVSDEAALIGAPVGAQESVRVSTVTPVREDITLTTTQPATIHAYFEADLASRVGGYVKAVKVDIGDSVAAGEVLAEIDAPELGNQAER